MSDRLPSWRRGPARDAILAFLDNLDHIPVEDRVACLDNDGTMWCEKPTYVQFDFFVDALQQRVADEPSLGERPEFAAVLSGDMVAIGELGLSKVAGALAALFDGQTPDQFSDAVDDFLDRYRHRTLGCDISGVIYQPMLELLDELRAHDFTIGIVTGGGTEFVRAISDDLYGVPPEAVVGTLIKYRLVRDADDRPTLSRTADIEGDANEGAAKVTNIQTQLGRRPVLAGGNSGGDREMLEWACAGDGPGLAILVDHDDAEREFRYVSTAETFTESEPITDVGARLGWTVVSMANDWEVVFPPLAETP